MKFLPAFMTAICWAMAMVATEKTIEHVNIKTYLLFSCLFSTIGFLLLGLSDNTLIGDFRKESLYVFGWGSLAALCAFAGSFFSVLAIKWCGAASSAQIELLYGLLSIFFSFLVFGAKKEFDPTIIIGSIIASLGVLIVVRGQ